MNTFTAVAEYLRETEGLHQEWEAYRLSVVEEEVPKGYIKVWGAVAPRQKKKPKLRNWRAKDPATKSVHFVEHEALKKWNEQKHEKAGTCPDCEGTGQRWVGWSRETGNRTRPCGRCGETGRYVAKEGRS